jgi:hypothetical protein
MAVDANQASMISGFFRISAIEITKPVGFNQ